MNVKGLLLLLCAVINGTAFVVRVKGMDVLEPFSFAAVRYFLAFLAMLGLLFITRKSRARERQEKNLSHGYKIGLLIGITLFLASSLLQVALQYTTAGKAAFIAALYIVFVPIVSKFLGNIIRTENILGVILATVGLYLLAIHEDFTIEFGDLILLADAFAWTAFILVINRFVKEVDLIETSTAEIFTTTVLSFIVMLVLESPTIDAILNSWFPILYAGMMCPIVLSLQLYAQRFVDPAVAAVLMSCEAVVATLAGWFFLNEVMSSREIFGCALMLAGTFATQWTLIKKIL